MVNKGKFVGHFFEVYMLFWKLVNVIANEKTCKGPKCISIKSTQVYLHKCITWPKKLGR
jgi:hypothetical protein